MGIPIGEGGFDDEFPAKGGAPIGGGGGGGGGGGPGGTPGYGGGGLSFGGPTLGGGSEAARLRAMLRKRMLGQKGVPYQAPGGGAVPAGGGTAALQAMVPGGAQPSMLSPMGHPGVTPGGIPRPGGPPSDPGVIPPGQRTGDLTDRSYNDPRVAPFVGLDLLIQHLGAGNLGPNPSQAMLDALKSEALGNAEAGRSRMELAGQAMGADPASRASYGLQAGLKGNSDVSQALNSAVTGAYGRREQFGQDLLRQMMAAIAAQNAATSGRGGGQDWGSLLGGIGTLAGAAFGPGGMMAGNAAGNAAGGALPKP